MAKLTAALVFVVIAGTVLASTSAYSREGGCGMEIQRMGMMRPCMNYLQSKLRSPFLNMGFKQDYLQQCCNELQRVSSECVCDVVSQMTRMMPQFGLMERVERMACELPRMCGMPDCGCSSY